MFKEWKAIFKRPKFIIVMLGVSLIPFLYNVIFLSSMWDPYGKLSDLPVAVVNKDRSTVLNGKTLAIGDQMVENMEKGKALDFHVVAQNVADKGLENGDYYMVVELPEDLSEKAASIMTTDPQQMKIHYKTSSGHGFVAGKMSDSAMNVLKQSVQKNIINNYTSTLFSSMKKLQTGMGTASAGSGQLVDGGKKLQSGTDQLNAGLQRLASSTLVFSNGANQLVTGLGQYTAGVHQLAGGVGLLATGVNQYTGGVAQVSAGADQLDAASAELQAGVQALQDAARGGDLNALVDGSNQVAIGMGQLANQLAGMTISSEQTETINQAVSLLTNLQSKLGQGQDPTAGIKAGLSQLETDLSALIAAGGTGTSTGVDAASAVAATAAFQKLDAAEQAEILAALPAAPSTTATDTSHLQALLGGVQALSLALDQNGAGLGQELAPLVDQALADLQTLQVGIGQFGQLQAATQTLAQGSSDVAAGLGQLQGQLQTGADGLVSGVSAYTSGVAELAQGARTLNENSGQLQAGVAQLQDGASQLDANSGALLDGAGQLASGASQLQEGSQTLAQGGDQLGTGMTSLVDGLASLQTGLDKANQQLQQANVEESNANTLSEPIALEKTEQDQVKVNGVGMAPYMISVALFVAAIATNTIFQTLPSGRQPSTRWSWLKARLEVNGVIALVAGFLVYGGIHLIGLTANHEMATLGVILLTSAAFMALVTTLVTLDNKVGAFLALILLLLQLGASAGTYPIQLSNSFFEALHPWLPMSYSVSALRETISMTGQIGSQVAFLSMTLVLSTLAGYFSYRPKK